jgi:hypothetical protein
MKLVNRIKRVPLLSRTLPAAPRRRREKSEARSDHRCPASSAVSGLRRIALIFGLVCPAIPSVASMQIDINFEADQATGNEWIRAQADYDIKKSRLYEILNAITEYPTLHGWIQDTKIESDAGNGRQEFLIKFKFPWPVGERWSRVEVRSEGDSVISWNQLEGSLKMNQGRITITGHERQARIDYLAIIDVGFPNAVTRSYKKKFVSEFLGAIQHRTNDGSQSPDETSAGAARLMLVTSNP